MEPQQPFFNLIFKYRYQISEIIFILWLALIGYWLYSFTTIEAEPMEDMYFLSEVFTESEDEWLNSTSSLVFLFWSVTTGVFVIGFVIFILKFAYNIVTDMARGSIPRGWHHLITPFVLLICLLPLFAYQSEIKSACLSFYDQGSVIWEKSGKTHSEIHGEGETKPARLTPKIMGQEQ